MLSLGERGTGRPAGVRTGAWAPRRGLPRRLGGARAGTVVGAVTGVVVFVALSIARTVVGCRVSLPLIRIPRWWPRRWPRWSPCSGGAGPHRRVPADAGNHGPSVARRRRRCHNRPPAWPATGSLFAARASTTSRTSIWKSRAISSSSSPGCRDRASRRWPSTRSTRRASGATWSRCPPTRASFSSRWRSRRSTPSRGCRRPSPSSRRRPPRIRAPRWAPSPRSTTTCACSSRASGCRTAHRAAGSSRPRPSSRWSIASWPSPRAHGSSSWLPWCEAARASIEKLFFDLARQGFTRVRVNGTVHELPAEIELAKNRKHTIEVVVDRIVVRENLGSRLADSLETALQAGRRAWPWWSPWATAPPWSSPSAWPARSAASRSPRCRRACSPSTAPTAPARSAAASAPATRSTPSAWCPTPSAR